MKLFKYSGSKVKLASLYKLPNVGGVNRIVEPYLGSAGFSLNYAAKVPVTGYEINTDLYEMWRWLRGTNEMELLDLSNFLDDLRGREDKPSLKDRGLDRGPLTYLRVNVCSVVVGQLSSWKVYPQHKLPIKDTIECLPRIKDFDIRLGSGEQFRNEPGDLVFVDPPYIDTSANYKSSDDLKLESRYNPQKTVDLISSLDCPIIFTYGTNAPEIFPQYNWEVVKVIKVPNMRRGGTTDRCEYVSYINF